MFDSAVTSWFGFNDPVSSLTHLLGAVACLVNGPRLLRRASGDLRRRTLLGVFVASAVTLLLVSGVYHCLPRGDARALMRRLDYAAIFVLIAGSYTPPLGILFRGLPKWGGLAFIWIVAGTGAVWKIGISESPREAYGLGYYLIMGWFGTLWAIDMGRRLGWRVIRPLAWSGLAYTIGGVVDVCERAIPLSGWFGPHEITHIAVLAGMAFYWRFVTQVAGIKLQTTPFPAGNSISDAISLPDAVPLPDGIRFTAAAATHRTCTLTPAEF